ncbi:MAG: hypothetical protein AAF430_08655 [Myxococcota bacterium]
MRWCLLLLIAGLCSGCFVLDELDAGTEIMDAHTPVKEGDAPTKSAGGAPGQDGEEAGPPTGQAWWSGAKSLNTAPQEPEAGDPNALVSCRLGNGTRFMRRSDCVSQGGRAG